MAKLIDANVILRYLLNDNEEMAEEAEAVIKGGAYTLPEVMAEVVYVLKGVYKMPRTEIAQCVHAILQIVSTNDSDVLHEAIDIYADTKLDFVDCILIAHHRVHNAEVFSFDKALCKKLK